MEKNNQLVDVSEARTFIEANWPNDPLLRQIAFNLLDKLPRVEQKWIPEKNMPMTNADRIRAMSDEELAYWIMCPYDSPYCDGIEHNCIECTKEWLQQPVEETK